MGSWLSECFKNTSGAFSIYQKSVWLTSSQALFIYAQTGPNSLGYNSISRSIMIPRRLGGGNEMYNLKVTRYTYVEEANDDTNKGSA